MSPRDLTLYDGLTFPPEISDLDLMGKSTPLKKPVPGWTSTLLGDWGMKQTRLTLRDKAKLAFSKRQSDWK